MKPATNNHKRKFTNGPVKWLLGRQLISGLKWIAVYALYGDKIHPRNWMRNEIEDFTGNEHIKTDAGEDCFWFDYMADSGDDDRAVYNAAYLCMSDLWLDQKNAVPNDPIRLTESAYQLPRGEFLFIGGDTAYHIADFSTLVERFQLPFNWAYEDLSIHNPEIEKKSIYAIPGNHDYYDSLDGFNRQFCKPIQNSSEQLALHGFERKQLASYVAIKLPFNWMLWGMDAQGGVMDFRQKSFFLSTCKNNKNAEYETPPKLIVATPEPTTKFGQWIDDTSPVVNTFAELSLPVNFTKTGGNPVNDKHCRLDISGDIHHYSRYWGDGPGEGQKQSNYASVIAGGGGAFLHASHTDVGDITPNMLYPSRKDSHNVMIKRLLNPLNIWFGGYVWLAGAIIVLCLYFAATIPDSTWSILSSNDPAAFIPNSIRPCTEQVCLNGSLLQRVQYSLSIESINSNRYSLYSLDFIFCLGLLALLVYVILQVRNNKSTISRASSQQWDSYRTKFLCFYVAVIGVKIMMILLLSSDPPYPAAASMLSLLYLVNAVAMLSYTRLLADIMIARKKYLNVTPGLNQRLTWRDENIPFWMLITAALVSACIGLWYYGTNKSAIALTDMFTLSLIIAAFFGLILLAVLIGGSLKTESVRFWGLLGVWHAVLQLSVVFLLMINNEWIEIAVIVSGLVVLTYLAPHFFLVKHNNEFSLKDQKHVAKQLLICWIVIGVLTLVLITYLGWGNPPMQVTGWRLLGAGILGAVMTCVWFGWYVAVSLGFNGHNNEAGGGARLPRYRHFIRFKVTENKLTGYVIGIDTPQDDLLTQQSRDATKPNIHLVDVFSIHARS